KHTILPRGATYVRARHGEEQGCWSTFKKVSKRIPGKGGLKSELSEVVRRKKELDVKVANPARINSSLERRFPDCVSHIVRKLQCLRLCNASLVATDRSESGTRAEIKRRKRMRGRVLADVHSGQVKLIQCIGAFDREADTGDRIRKTEAKLVHQFLVNGV